MHQDTDIFIAGAGGIGRAVGLLLANYPEISGRLHIGDCDENSARQAAQWINEGKAHPIAVRHVVMPEEGLEGLGEYCSPGGVILDCLPGSEAPRMAQLALDQHMHYANLTEYVDETNTIMEMAKDAETGFVLQTGLAPGFINILAHKLYQDFVSMTGKKEVEHIRMRVGAITDNTRSPHFYGFTWSPIGVATEYVKDSVVLENGEKRPKPALSARETMIIDGTTFEADLTSGGAADLPDAFLGIAKHLDYKTLRYPGHYDWVKNKLNQLEGANRIQDLEDWMLNNIPAVEDDLIVIYASVIGYDGRGTLRKIEKSYQIKPTVISGKTLRAIQSTTAAPLAECARLLLKNTWKGVVLQSEIDPRSFMSGPFVQRVYEHKVRQNGVSLPV